MTNKKLYEQLYQKRLKKLGIIPITKETTVEPLEKKYNVRAGVPSNTKVWEFLEQKGYPTLARMIRIYR